MTRSRRGRRSLSSEDARRAVYIDFEGTATDRATFLGMYCEGSWAVVILERIFDAAVERGHPRGVVTSSEPLDAFFDLRRRVTEEERAVVAWSIRERDEIRGTDGLSASDRAWWDSNLVNALPIAKRWAKSHEVEVPVIRSTRGGDNAWSLSGFRKATQYPAVARLFEPGLTASRIRHVRGQLQRRGTYANLTGVAKRKWVNVLTHNFHDCAGLAHVMNVVADASSRRE